VYIVKIVGTKRLRRWIVAPQIFGFYKHLGFAKVKVVDPAALASFVEVQLVRADGDQDVYYLDVLVPGARAEKRWIPSPEAFLAAGFDWDWVYVINKEERNWYKIGADHRTR